MSDDWNSLDKIIVDALCENATVSPVDIHAQYRVSPISIFQSVDRLSASGLAEVRNGKIVRPEGFVGRVVQLRHAIYNRRMPWKDIR